MSEQQDSRDFEPHFTRRIPISFDAATFKALRDLAVRKGTGVGVQVRLLVQQALKGTAQ